MSNKNHTQDRDSKRSGTNANKTHSVGVGEVTHHGLEARPAYCECGHKRHEPKGLYCTECPCYVSLEELKDERTRDYPKFVYCAECKLPYHWLKKQPCSGCRNKHDKGKVPRVYCCEQAKAQRTQEILKIIDYWISQNKTIESYRELKQKIQEIE